MSSNQDSVEIAFRAKVDELIAGLQQATGAMTTGFQSITQVVQEASQAIEQELAGAVDAAKKEIEKLNEGNQETSDQLDNIAGKVNIAFAWEVAGKAAEYVKALIAEVQRLGEAASDVLDTAYAFGITTKELQGLQALSVSTGTDFEAVNRVLLILQTRLLEAAQGSKEAAEDLATFGITAKNFNDETFTSVDALVKVAQSSANAAEKIQLFGRNNVSALGVLGPLANGLNAVSGAAESAGAATREQLEALAGFNTMVNTVNLELENLKVRLLSAIVPALQTFMKVLKELVTLEGPIVDLLGGALYLLGKAVQGLATVGTGAAFLLKQAFENIGTVIKGAAEAVIGFAKTWYKFNTLDFKGAWEEGKKTIQGVKETFTTLWEDSIDGANRALLAAEDVFDALGGKGSLKPGETVAGDDSEKRPDRGKAQARKQEKDDYAEKIKFEYDLAKEGSERRIELANQLVTRMALVYGQDSDQYRSAVRQQLEAVRQFNEAQAKLAEERLERARALALGEVEIAEEKFSAEVDAGRVSAEEIYRQQEEFANRRLQIEENYLNQLKQLRAEDALAVAQSEQDLLLAQQERQKAQVENMNERAKEIRTQWEGILSPISSAFSGAIQGMIQGTETLANAVRKMALNIILSFADLAVKKTIKWIAGEIAMTQATAANSAVRSTLEETSSKKGILAGAFAALKKIAQYAATAAAGAFQAIVSIPYVGPFLAPAAAAAAGAAVLALGRSIASAAGGWEVPSDQLAMVHKDEMVLPARLSQGLKNLIFDRSSSEGGGGGGMTFAPTVMAMDGDSVRKFFNKNGSALARAMWEQAQRFNPKASMAGMGGMMTGTP